MTLTLSPSPASDLVGFAAGRGHPDYPCLSRTHAPASCVPCADFSPWLAERVRRRDVDGVADYLYRIREANPGLGESPDQLRANYTRLADGIVNAHARPISGWRRRDGLPGSAGHAGPAGGARGVFRLHHDGRGGRLRGFGGEPHTLGHL